MTPKQFFILSVLILIWGPETVDLVGINLSKLLRPTAGIKRTDINNYKWTTRGYTFIFISDPVGILDGMLMYINNDIAHKITAFHRPMSRMLSSGNNVKYVNSGSYPNNLRIEIPLPLSPTIIRGNDLQGAKLSSNVIIPDPKYSVMKTVGTLSAMDFLTSDEVFILTRNTFDKYKISSCFYDPFATVKPFDYTLYRVVRCGTDKFETVMRVGKDVGSLLMSFADSSALEVIVVKNSVKLKVLWPSQTEIEPVHSEPITELKTYVLGSALGPPDSEYKLMIDIAGCVDESLDGNFQLSSLHETLLLFATNKIISDDPYLFKIILTRMFMALFSQIRTALRSGFILLRDMLQIEADFKMIMKSIPYIALGGNLDSDFLELNSLFEDQDVKQRLRSSIDWATQTALSSGNLEKRQLSLLATYAIQDRSPGKNALMLAINTIEILHSEAVRGKLQHNATVSRIMFYAFSLLLGGKPTDLDSTIMGRKAFILATSMCTNEKAAKDDVVIQEAFIHISDRKKPFNILDWYTPCAVSLRFDLNTYAHRIYASASVVSSFTVIDHLKNIEQVSSSRGSGAIEEEQLETKAMNTRERWREITKWATWKFLPETYACDSKLYHGAVMILPMYSNKASYIVGRRPLMHGISYRVDGVTIGNQLYLTYLTEDLICGDPIYGTIIMTTLPRPRVFDDCIYCGCVLLRYESSGDITYAIYIADEELQNELVASTNSTISYFNPTMAKDEYGVTLLLFPNGTVIRVTAFDFEKITTLSIAYIASASAGLIITVLIIAVIVRMVLSFVKGSLSYSYDKLRSATPESETADTERSMYQQTRKKVYKHVDDDDIIK